ncbi:NDUF B6 domain containing protein [Asbolus verrucosus]|uniref:NDUF B6 domain containing protein n=1 Tax=Asbolus verrucosus TaxID=1661398 RepID=A0A482VEJ8_ASBVE|nr:NDUF B6 domain containing protein [Asbolus verrucosus]
MVKGSQTAGVKPMSISGRFNNDRERLLGMTDEERAFRKQWLKDQHLAPNEPRPVPEMYKALYNPIRRAYRFPLDQLAKILTPVLGEQRAIKIRYFTGKFLLGIATAYWFTYYFKYNANDWTRYGGWRVLKSREAVFEGDPGYPRLSDRTKPSDYGTRGFENCKLDL